MSALHLTPFSRCLQDFCVNTVTIWLAKGHKRLKFRYSYKRACRAEGKPMAYAYEKRDFERVKVNTAVTLYHGVRRTAVEGICVDISDSGIGLDLEHVVPIGTECLVKVHDGFKNREPFQALIEIKHTTPLNKGRCRVGAAILEMF